MRSAREKAPAGTLAGRGTLLVELLGTGDGAGALVVEVVELLGAGGEAEPELPRRCPACPN